MKTLHAEALAVANPQHPLAFDLTRFVQAELDALFARQVDALGRPGDVAMGISTSGNSANVIEGLAQARMRGMGTIGMTGASAGRLAPLCDAIISVPSAITARIQEMRILVGHMLCKALEQRLELV